VIKLATTGEVADMTNFAGRASSIHVTETFRIENNQIRRVEMIGTSVPCHFNSTWAPFLSGKWLRAAAPAKAIAHDVGFAYARVFEKGSNA
jgi:hypothetical protein